MPDKNTPAAKGDAPEITITGAGAAPLDEQAATEVAAPDAPPTDAPAAGAAAASEAPIAEGAEGKPATIATQLAPSTVERVQSLVPGAQIDGEPDPHASVKWGIFSHILDGLTGVLHGHLGVIAGAASAALERPSVQKLGDDIEDLALKQTELAFEMLKKSKAILMGDVDVIIHDAEAAARDLAFAVIPPALREGVTGVITRIIAGSHEQAKPEVDDNGKPQHDPTTTNILVAIQHGINALGTRLTHIGG